MEVREIINKVLLYLYQNYVKDVRTKTYSIDEFRADCLLYSDIFFTTEKKGNRGKIISNSENYTVPLADNCF